MQHPHRALAQLGVVQQQQYHKNNQEVRGKLGQVELDLDARHLAVQWGVEDIHTNDVELGGSGSWVGCGIVTWCCCCRSERRLHTRME